MSSDDATPAKPSPLALAMANRARQVTKMLSLPAAAAATRLLPRMRRVTRGTALPFPFQWIVVAPLTTFPLAQRRVRFERTFRSPEPKKKKKKPSERCVRERTREIQLRVGLGVTGEFAGLRRQAPRGPRPSEVIDVPNPRSQGQRSSASHLFGPDGIAVPFTPAEMTRYSRPSASLAHSVRRSAAGGWRERADRVDHHQNPASHDTMRSFRR